MPIATSSLAAALVFERGFEFRQLACAAGLAARHHRIRRVHSGWCGRSSEQRQALIEVKGSTDARLATDLTDESAVLRHTLTNAIARDPEAALDAEPGLVHQLRNYERHALQTGIGRQALQVIMSARRLIGDRVPLSDEGADSE